MKDDPLFNGMVRVRVKIRGRDGAVLKTVPGYCFKRGDALAVTESIYEPGDWLVTHRKSGYTASAGIARTKVGAIKLAAKLEPLAQWDEIYKAMLPWVVRK